MTRTEHTNYDGDWNAKCSFCGREHREHQVEVGELDGVRYVHRQPCEEEQYEIRKRAVAQGVVIRTIVLCHDVLKYVWDRIPFKKEARLVWSAVKHLFVTARALVYLRTTKPK